MWRSTRLVRKAFLNGAAKFRAPENTCNPQVFQSHESLLPPLASYYHRKLSHVTSWVSLKSPFDGNPRFYSSNPYPENEDFFTEKPVIDSRNDYDENPSGANECFHSRDEFDENIFGANKGFGDDNVVSFDSRLDFDEGPSPNFSEFAAKSEKTDDLLGNFNGFDSRNGDNDKTGGVVAGEDDNVVFANDRDKTDKTEDMVEKLETLLSLLQSSGNEKPLESSLEDMGLVLNEEFVLRVLETPFISGENLIGFLKWVFKKSEILVTRRAIDSLVRAISNEFRARNAYALWDLVKDAGGKDIGVVSTETLNELLYLFSRLGKGKVAFEVFNKFEDFGCDPDADTYYFTIDALCKRMIFDWACSVCEKMVNADKLPQSEKVGKIVSHLCKGKKLKDAHTVYLWAKDRKIYPSQSALNFLIILLCGRSKMIGEDKKQAKDETHSPSQPEIVSQGEKENVYLALKLLDDFSEKERTYAIKPFSSVIEGLCRIRDFEGAKKLLFQMMESCPPPGHTIFNTIITGLSKAGDMEEAMKMLKIMEDRGLKPDVYSYTVIISGYVQGGAMEEARKVFNEAKRKHSKLSSVTYHSMIRGYCKLEQFEEALEFMEEMKKHGVQPNADEYNKLIKSLCLKALDWKTATKLLEEMLESGLHLNEKTKCLVRSVKELQEEIVESKAVETAR